MKKAFAAISAKTRERLQGRGDESICNFIEFLIAPVRNISTAPLLWVFSNILGRQRHQEKFPVPSWIHTTLSHHLFNMPWCCVCGVRSTEGTPESYSGLGRNLKGLQKATKNAKILESSGRAKSHYFTISKTPRLIWQTGKCFLWFAVEYIACIAGWHSCTIPRHFLGADAFTFTRLLTEKGHSCYKCFMDG